MLLLILFLDPTLSILDIHYDLKYNRAHILAFKTSGLVTDVPAIFRAVFEMNIFMLSKNLRA